MKYEFLLFDADNTILDFDKSEELALRLALENASVKFDENVLTVYKRNNIACWEKLERGEMTKDQVLVERFLLTAKELGWKIDVDKVAVDYENELKNGFYVVPHSREVLAEAVKRGHKLYLVSNGVLAIQNSRMAGSDMNKYFIKRFISEEVGCPKPQVEFFAKSFSQIDGFEKQNTLIIGDSLTSDIKGGNNAGIATCWFNPSHKTNRTDARVDYEIDDLRSLFDII